MRAARACAVCLALLLALALVLLYASRAQSLPESTRTPVAASKREPVPAGDAHEQLLFPDLCSSAITAVSLRTNERSFEFRCDGPDNVSVNGQRADSEAFLTLVSQIAQFPVDAHAAFPAEGADELLELVVSTGETQHVARFYEDSAQGTQTYIVCGTQDAPSYRKTDGWRVGTLLMACEGTRIQDERGNETPADE